MSTTSFGVENQNRYTLMVIRKHYAVVFIHRREYIFCGSIRGVSRVTGLGYRTLLSCFRRRNYYGNSEVEVYRLEAIEGSGSEG